MSTAASLTLHLVVQRVPLHPVLHLLHTVALVQVALRRAAEVGPGLRLRPQLAAASLAGGAAGQPGQQPASSGHCFHGCQDQDAHQFVGQREQLAPSDLLTQYLPAPLQCGAGGSVGERLHQPTASTRTRRQPHSPRQRQRSPGGRAGEAVAQRRALAPGGALRDRRKDWNAGVGGAMCSSPQARLGPLNTASPRRCQHAAIEAPTRVHVPSSVVHWLHWAGLRLACDDSTGDEQAGGAPKVPPRLPAPWQAPLPG